MQLGRDAYDPLRRQKDYWHVATSILSAIYHILKSSACYQYPGPGHFDH